MYILGFSFKDYSRGGGSEVAQQVASFPPMPCDLSLIPGTHIKLERETQLHEVALPCTLLPKCPPHTQRYILNLYVSGGLNRYGLARVGVVLLEEICHWGWTLGFEMLRLGINQSLSLPPSFLTSFHPSLPLSPCCLQILM